MHTARRAIAVGIFLGMVSRGVPADAGTFWGATVKNAPPSDPLNVRSIPSPKGRVQRTFVTGDSVSLAGSCKNSATGRTFNIENVSNPQARMDAANVWCMVFHEDGATYQVGWARGRYLKLDG